MLEEALEFISHAWAVFPLTARGKNPAIKGGFKSATADEEQVKALWGAHPNYNIGIATGAASGGLVVIDLDVDEDRAEDGMATLREWELSHGELPETATVKTGSGGCHLYYMCDVPISCSVDPDRGVDIRADGGYVVAPPSIHPNGNEYAWEFPPDEIGVAQADDNVMAFIAFVQGGKRAKRQKFKLPDVIRKGERNDQLMRLASSLQSYGLSDEIILATVQGTNKALCEMPLPDNEVEAIVESVCWRYKKGTPKDQAQIALTFNQKGEPKRSIENCLRIINADASLAGHFYFDSRSYTRMVSLPVPWDEGEGERQLQDVDYINLTAYIEKRHFIVPITYVTNALQSVCMSNPRNLVAEWLDSLVWDGKDRIITLLPAFLGTAIEDYTCAVMRLFMLGAVTRAYNPGTKFDYMPVLVGKQGIGKSFFVRKLAMRDDWFSDNFNTVSGDEAIEKLRGLWIAEMAELLATKRAKDVESIKAFISSTADTYRPKYARETVQRKRGCVFVGTTNDYSFLTDTSGNRRFLPVKCGVIDPSMNLFDARADEYFLQAWAEAVHIYKTETQPLMLNEKTAEKALEMQEEFQEDDPRVGIIQEWLDNLAENTSSPERLYVCAQQIIEEALPEDDRRGNRQRLVNDVNRIMRTSIFGWERSEKVHRFHRYGVQRTYIPSRGD